MERLATKTAIGQWESSWTSLMVSKDEHCLQEKAALWFAILPVALTWPFVNLDAGQRPLRMAAFETIGSVSLRLRIQSASKFGSIAN